MVVCKLPEMTSPHSSPSRLYGSPADVACAAKVLYRNSSPATAAVFSFWSTMPESWRMLRRLLPRVMYRASPLPASSSPLKNQLMLTPSAWLMSKRAFTVGDDGFRSTLYSLETRSWAVFGQLEYGLSDSLTLSGGLRWTEDNKDFETNASCVDRAPNTTGCDDFGLVQGAGQPLPTVADLSPLSLDRSDSDFTGKIQLDRAVSDDLPAYAGFNRGMKAGGF